MNEELYQLLVDDKYGHGATHDSPDQRDFSQDEIALGAAQIDWEKGYDIRNELGGDITIKNQFASLSCVGQAWAYYLWVLMVKDLMKKYSLNLAQLLQSHAAEVAELSAKAIYSLISLGFGKGATLRAGALLGLNYGALHEAQVPSYHDGTTDEAWMFSKEWKDAAMDTLAATLKGKDARVISACDNMDLFALSILQNHGVVGGVIGSNGRGWGSGEFPNPPEAMDKLWGHCLFYGAYGTDEHGKFIAFPNSWGQIVDRPQGPWQPGMAPGYGWQKLRLNYFTKELQFNPWTYTDKPAEVVDPTTVPADFAHVFNTPLYFGMKNAEVIALQTALSLNGHLDPKCITGYYGPLTAAAVLEFQLVNNVDTVNILTQLKGRQVGPKTLLMLNRMFSVSK